MVLEELWWVLGLSQGLAWPVVLPLRGCVPPASLQELVLESPRGARGPKSHLALGDSRTNVTVK